MDSFSSFRHGIRAFRDKNFLSPKDSYLILEGLQQELTIHNSENDVLEELSKNHYKGKKSKIIKKMLTHIENDEPSEDVFLRYGLITKDEYLIFAKSNSFKDSVNNVLEHREEGDKFPILASKIVFIIVFFVTLSLSIVAIAGRMVVHFFQINIKPVLDEKIGYSVDLNFPIFFENTYVSSAIIAIWLIIVCCTLYSFFYIYKTNPRRIYKFFPMKFYDDFIKYFSIAGKMKRIGVPPDDIFEYLSLNVTPVGLRKMFAKMIEEDGEIATALRIFNCPEILVSKIITAEETNNFWKYLDSKILLYAKTSRDTRLKITNRFVVLPLVLMGSLLLVISIAWVVLTLVKTLWIASRF